MLITNPNFSLTQLYTDEFNKLLSDGTFFNCDYKCYEKDKDFFVFFQCFDLKTDVKLSSNLLFEMIAYEGYLKFDYHKSTNEVYIREVPRVKCKNGNVAVFTSDLVSIIVDKVKKYSDEGIKIRFDNQLPLMVIDDEAVKLIPSIADTPHYKRLRNIINEIHKEEDSISKKTKQYKAQKDREDRKKEIAIAKKRKILGIDPNNFMSIEDFNAQLEEKLKIIWNNRLINIERHLNANIDAYKKTIKDNRDNYHFRTSFSYILTRYIYHIAQELGMVNNKCNPQYLDSYMGTDYDPYKVRQLLNNSRIIDYLNQKFCSIEINASDIAKIYDYFKELKDGEQINKKMLNNVINIILEFDLTSSGGILANYKKNYVELDDFRNIAHRECLGYSGYYCLYYEFLLDRNCYYKYRYFHPALLEYSDDICYYSENSYFQEDGCLDYFKITYHMAETGFHIKPIDLLVQIEVLMQKREYYRNLLNNPNEVILKFYKNSTLWGSIMQIPYWFRYSWDHYMNGGHESFGLFMIQPNVKSVDLEKTIQFEDGMERDNPRKKTRKGASKFYSCNRIMITIPKSLSYNEIEKILEYFEACSYLNIVCESFETTLIVKKYFINWYVKYGSSISKRVFINIDPTYYDSFLVDTPNNKVFWHRYDYSSDYKYRRKDMLSFDKQIEIALKYCRIGDKSYDYWMLDEILLGGYSSDSLFSGAIKDYNTEISDITCDLEKQLSKKHK